MNPKSKPKPRPKPTAPAREHETSAAAPAKPPTATQLAAFLGATITKPLTTDQIRHLLKALPGYVNVLDDAAEQYEVDAAVLAVKDVSSKDLLAVKVEQKDLAKREAIAYEVYRSLYEQRMQADDRAIGMLRKIGRRIAALSDDHPDLRTDWKNVLDFLAQFAPNRGPRTPPATPPDPTQK